jgi:hypothetical protein
MAGRHQTTARRSGPEVTISMWLQCLQACLRAPRV